MAGGGRGRECGREEARRKKEAAAVREHKRTAVRIEAFTFEKYKHVGKTQVMLKNNNNNINALIIKYYNK